MWGGRTSLLLFLFPGFQCSCRGPTLGCHTRGGGGLGDQVLTDGFRFLSRHIGAVLWEGKREWGGVLLRVVVLAWLKFISFVSFFGGAWGFLSRGPARPLRCLSMWSSLNIRGGWAILLC